MIFLHSELAHLVSLGFDLVYLLSVMTGIVVYGCLLSNNCNLNRLLESLLVQCWVVT